MATDGRKFEKLVTIMAQLRGPHGCPWDKEQTHESLVPTFLEELHEFIEAVEDGDFEAMKEELGDLCLHLVFQARLASERKRFAIGDVLDGIAEKLIRRHPHVFGTVKAKHAADVLRNWEHIKRAEKKKGRTSVVDGVPRRLPALSKAHAVQRKVKRVGFEWRRIKDVMAKVDEELGELRAALASGRQAAITEELGDLLFSIVNLARFVEVEPERALHKTVRKFMDRFREVESRLALRGKTPEQSTLEEMDALWTDIKKARKRTRSRA